LGIATLGQHDVTEKTEEEEKKRREGKRKGRGKYRGSGKRGKRRDESDSMPRLAPIERRIRYKEAEQRRTN